MYHGVSVWFILTPIERPLIILNLFFYKSVKYTKTVKLSWELHFGSSHMRQAFRTPIKASSQAEAFPACSVGCFSWLLRAAAAHRSQPAEQACLNHPPPAAHRAEPPMAAAASRRSRGAWQSPFFRDMASPIPSRRGVSPYASAASPAAAPPPPPIFTLDDRYASADFFPDPTASDLLPVASSPSPSAAASSSPSWYWDWAWGRGRGRTSLSAPGSPMDGVVEPSLNHAREEWVTVFG